MDSSISCTETIHIPDGIKNRLRGLDNKLATITGTIRKRVCCKCQFRTRSKLTNHKMCRVSNKVNVTVINPIKDLGRVSGFHMGMLIQSIGNKSIIRTIAQDSRIVVCTCCIHLNWKRITIGKYPAVPLDLRNYQPLHQD